MNEQDQTLDIKTRAKLLAGKALNRRVSPAEWKVALEVSEFILGEFDKEKSIPMKEALSASLRAISIVGHEVVSSQRLGDLLSALDDFGMNKSFATDSPKLRKVKEALQRFRFTPGVF